jgi:hypothetical protein
MTITYKSTATLAVGVGPTPVYTGPAATQAIVLGMEVCNLLTDPVTVTIRAATAAIAFNMPIPPGTTLVAIGKDERVVIEATETITVACNVAAAVDVLVSTLEIS